MFNVRHLHGRIAAWTAIAGAALAISTQPVSAQPSYKWGVGNVAPGTPVVLKSLPPYVPGTETAAEAPPPATGLSESEYRQEKRRRVSPPPGAKLPNPQAAAAALAGAPGAAPPSFEGNNTPKCGYTAAFDMALAVGERSEYSVVQVNNYCINVFTKEGKPAPGFPKRLDGLFPFKPFPKSPFDPRALYDWVNGRYIIVTSEQYTGDGHYWVAVSASVDPDGLYYVYRLPVPSGGRDTFADFPRLGQDKRAIYIASNVFGYSAGGFQHEEWLMLPKQEMYQGKRFTYKFAYDLKFAGALTDTSQPANIWHPADDPGVGFLVASKTLKAGGLQCKDTPCNGLTVYAIANPLWDGTGTDPGISGAAVATTHDYQWPPMVKQGPSTSGDAIVDVGDTRIAGQVSYAAGSLFASLTTANTTGGASALLFKILPHMYNPQVRMLIGATITDEAALPAPEGSNASTFLATTQPDAQGNTLTVYNVAGPKNDLSAYCMLRSATQPPGTFPNTGILVRAGGAVYGNAYNWGHYTAAAPQLMLERNKPAALWFSAGYTRGSNIESVTADWYSVIGNTTYSSPTRP